MDTLPIIDSWKVEGPPISSKCGFCNIRMQTWQDRIDHLAKHFREGSTMDDWKGDHYFEPHIAAKVRHAMPPYLIGPESRALIPFSVNSHGTQDHLSQIRQASEQSLGTWDKERASREELPPESSAQQEPSDLANKDPRSMTFPEILALHLGHYAQEQMRLGVIPTDTMFQNEARKIMFDSIDPWDQTIADNTDWLNCFRIRHLRDIPSHQEGSN
ncbi:hypothetical protein HJFPF1_13303 [Paramyrothecium foliicola]|nr:hypothetical protein HJFPF1_13303 [Paramyrothecium foliicola]